MADFALNDEQTLLRALAREFARREMAPVASYYDRTGEFPWEVIRKAHAAGLMNGVVPEEHGGSGLSVFDDCLVQEELAAGCSGIASCIVANNLALIPIVLAATEEQKERFLRPLTGAPRLAAFCLTEPTSGSDAASLKTRAVRDGDCYVLSGTKRFITNGGVAHQYTVFARTNPDASGPRGVSAFVVPRDAAGVAVGKEEDKMGQRAANTAEIIFDAVRIPAANRLGEEGQGFRLAMTTLDRSRAGIAAAAVGLARAAMEHAVAYAQQRKQFGQPIADFQAIQFMLADMAIKVETARMMVWKAAWLIDQGSDARFESSIAKCYASDAAMQVTTDAVQVFGGVGYMKDYPVEKLMRDAKLIQIYEGTNQIQRLVVSRALLNARR